ncbi:MAG TPA: hypothetical protein VF721_12245 [Pyrinomonadaceae bacterium]|jgi:hypothetical protein
MQSKQAIGFRTKVTEEDWDEALSAWRCPALKIPGAEIESIFVSGNSIDSSWYKVIHEQDIVRWVRSGKHPPEATFLIKLTEELSTKELTLKWKQLAVILPFITSVLVALLTGIISYALKASPDPVIITSACTEELKIIAPTDNATVSRPVTVQWKHKDLASGEKVYIMVYPTDIGRYYPQPKAAAEQPDNTWSSETSIGNESDVGRIFFIHAVIANKDAQNELNTYINRFKETDDSPGLIELPKGARVCSSVRVKRK